MDVEAEPVFGRLVTAMVTPFNNDGMVDLGRAARVAHHLADTGSDAIFVAGTTGEAPTLSDDEKIDLCRAVTDAVGDQVKVLAGTGTYDTQHSVKLSQRAAQAGVDGLVAVTPYYNRPTQRGLEAHFTAIADATELPILLYNIPSRTARLIDPETVCTLACHPHIVGVKDATGDIAHSAAVRAGTPEDFAIYAGDDISTLSIMAIGGVGVVSVAAHVAGPQLRTVIESFLAGQPEHAASAFIKLQPLLAALFLEPNPIPIKAALKLIDLDPGEPRLPLTSAEESTIASLADALAHIGLR